jgi:hypothetical protein
VAPPPALRHDARVRALAILLAAAALAPAGATAASPPVARLVEQTLAATARVRSFHFALQVDHPPLNPAGLSIASAVGDVRVPDRLAARFSGTLSGITLKSALVFVGTRYYLQDPFSGKWRNLDANTNPVKFFNPAKGVLAVIRGARGLVMRGSERVSGVDCWRVAGKAPSRSLVYVLGAVPSPRLVPVTIWLGKDDHVLRRVRLEGPINKGDSPRVARQLTVSSLDEQVKIEAPKVTG